MTWGEGLVVQAHREAGAGGLKAAVDRITAVIGPHIGTRGTFAKFYGVENPDYLSQRDRWRAWLLLVALGLEPSEWGIADTVVPTSLDVDFLKKELPARLEGFEPPTF